MTLSIQIFEKRENLFRKIFEIDQFNFSKLLYSRPENSAVGVTEFPRWRLSICFFINFRKFEHTKMLNSRLKKIYQV